MADSGAGDRRLFEHELQERLDRVLFASPSHRSIERLAQTLETLTRAQQERVLHWAGIAAKTYAEIGYLLASLAPQAFAQLDDAGFDAWALAALDRYDRDGLRPAMALLRDIEGFRVARNGALLARFGDVEARLTRFVRGLSGRPLALRVGSPAWTDTETLFLPEALAERSTAEDNRRLYKANAALLWAQTRYGTFNADIDAVIASLPDRSLALAWLALLEAVRLDARIAAELPGLADEMAALRGPWPEVLGPALPRLSAPGASVQDSLDLLGEFVVQGRVPPRLAVCGMLDPTAARRVRAERIARETKVLRNALAALKGAGGRRQSGEALLDVAAGEDGALEIRVDGEVLALPPEAQAAAQSLVQDLGQLPPEVLSPAGPGGWLPADKECCRRPKTEPLKGVLPI